MTRAAEHGFIAACEALAAAGKPARFWLRDDDAVAPSDALDRLLSLTSHQNVPLTLAVIPAFAGLPLAHRLAGMPGVDVAVHGWAHVNHAPPGEKKQELGTHRPVERVLQELVAGRLALQQLFGGQAAPVLVPPWNRVSPEIVAGLPQAGFEALSVFGPEKAEPLRVINTHLDVMDWHGTGGGRLHADLFADLARVVARGRPVGVLTHHLVHDAQAWSFLERLFVLTSGRAEFEWLTLPQMLAHAQKAQASG